MVCRPPRETSHRLLNEKLSEKPGIFRWGKLFKAIFKYLKGFPVWKNKLINRFFSKLSSVRLQKIEKMKHGWKMEKKKIDLALI